MRLHPSIVCFSLMLGAGGCGGGDARLPADDLRGRVAMSWTLDGAFLQAQSCQTERIDFMEVEVRSLSGGGSIGYTQVRCDLDRYSLDMTPLGSVLLRVGAMGKDSRGMPCLRRYGEAPVRAATSYPEAPARIELKAVAGACR